MNRLLVLGIAVAMLVTVLTLDANAGPFGRRGCNSGCNTSCGSGGSQGCKINNAPTKAAEAVDLFKEDPAVPPAPPAPPVSKVNFSKDSALAFTSRVKLIDRTNALAFTSRSMHKIPGTLLASK